MNFCKDCKHLLGNRNYTENWQNWKCGKTKEQTGVNPVNGEPIIKAFFCTAMREVEADCGSEGKWFEVYIPPSFLNPESEPSKLKALHKGKLTSTDLENL